MTAASRPKDDKEKRTPCFSGYRRTPTRRKKTIFERKIFETRLSRANKKGQSFKTSSTKSRYWSTKRSAFRLYIKHSRTIPTPANDFNKLGGAVIMFPKHFIGRIMSGFHFFLLLFFTLVFILTLGSRVASEQSAAQLLALTETSADSPPRTRGARGARGARVVAETTHAHRYAGNHRNVASEPCGCVITATLSFQPCQVCSFTSVRYFCFSARAHLAFSGELPPYRDVRRQLVDAKPTSALHGLGASAHAWLGVGRGVTAADVLANSCSSQDRP